MRVIKVKYQAAAKTRPYPENVSLEIELAEGESVQEAIRRARITAKIAFGEVPTGERADRIASRMRLDAANLSLAADDLGRGGFE